MHKIYKAILLFILCISFFVSAIQAEAATRIGANMYTDGTLTVNGALKFTSGAAADYILRTDAVGNATWISMQTAITNAGVDADDIPEGTSNFYYTDAKVDARITLQAGAPGGLATLGGDGKLTSGQVPAIAINDTYAVADITARDALVVQKGDVAIVADSGAGDSRSYIWDGTAWLELLTPLSLYLAKANNLSDLADAPTARTNIGLGNVENVALSTWAGSVNLTSLGTVVAGTWNGNTIPVTYGGTGLTAIGTGEILYGSAPNVLSPLAAGTAGFVLQANGVAAPSWVDTTAWDKNAANDLTTGSSINDLNDVTITSADAGDLLYYNGTAWVDLSDGAAGEVLSSNGAGGLSWVSVAGGAGDITAVGDVLTGNAFTATIGSDGNSLYFEGTTGDSTEVQLTAADPGADVTVIIPASNGTLLLNSNNLSDVSNTGTARTNLGLGTGDSPSFTGLTVTGGTAQVGNATTAGNYRVADGSANYITITSPAIAGDYTLTLPTTDGGAGEYLQTDGAGNLSWAAVAGGAGDITAVGDILTGAAFTETAGNDGNALWLEGSSSDTFETKLTATDPTADNTITFPNASGEVSLLGQTIESSEITDGTVTTDDIADNTITATDLNATLTFADGDLINLSAINMGSANEGLILGQNTSCVAATAEGQVCWDSDSDLLYVGDGAAAVSIGNPFGASIDSTDITNNTITTADIADDELDYVDFKDAMAVDADTSTNLAGNDLTFTDATGGGAFSVTTNGAAISLTSNGTATWAVTGAGNDLTIDAADVLGLGTANATAVTIGKAGVTTTNIGTFQTGNAANAGNLKVADGSANYITITSPAIGADYTLTLPTTDGASGEYLQTDGSGNLTWSAVAGGAGDITAVGDILTGAAFTETAGNDGNALWLEGSTANTFETKLTATDPTADNTITFPNASGEVSLLGQTIESSEITDGTVTTDDIADNTITATDLNATLTFADGDLINLSAINMGSTNEGLILGQNTSCAAATAEGQVCWDSDSDLLYVGDGAAAVSIGNPFGASIDSTDITNNTITTADIADDELDYVDFKDAMAVDADTSTNLAGNDLTFSDATGGGAFSITTNGAAISLTSNGTATWSVTGAGNDLTIDSADVLNLGTANATAITMGKAGVTTTNIGVLQTGNAANAGSLKVADGSANYITITSPAIGADYTLTLPTTDGASGEYLQTDGSGNLTWSAVAGGAGDITAVGDILTGAAFTETAGNDGNALWLEGSTANTFETKLTATDPTADNTITFPNASGEVSLLGQTIESSEITDGTVTTDDIADNTITATDLNATLTFADGDLINLSAINMGSANEGLILGQNTSCAAATAEGQVCWDSDSDLLYVGDGAAAVSIGNPFGASIDSTDITNNTITTADIADDELDYVDFKDAMAVDADTSTNLAGNDLTFSDATGGGAFSVTTNGAAISLTSNGTATWAVTGAGNDLTIDAADVLGLGTANATAVTIGKAGVTTTNIGTFQTGNAANAGNLKVADGSANYITITSPAIGADYTLTLPTTDGAAGEYLQTDGSGNLTWSAVAGGAGDITAVGDILTGAAFTETAGNDGNALWLEGSTANTFETKLTATDPTADNTITFPNASGEVSLLGQTIESSEITDGTVTTDDIADNTITATDLNATLTFADGDLINLSAINMGSTNEGLILGQNTSCAAATAEGQVCWDSDSDLLYVGDGAAAVSIGNPFGASIDSTDITNNTITTADIADDELDYVDFKDAMAVDADTSTNLAGNDLTFSDATGGGAFSVTTNGAAISLTSNGTATWAVTGAGNDLTIDAADVLSLGTANATAITLGKAGVTTTNIGTFQTGNAANAGNLKVADGSANYITITSPAIASDYTLTLPTNDGDASQYLQTDGSGNLSWATVTSGTGDITAVGDILTGAAFTETAGNDGNALWLEGSTANTFETKLTATDPTADNTITFPNASGEVSLLGQTIESSEITDGTVTTDDIADNTITATDLNATLTFADGDLINLSAINMGSANEGLILGQNTSCVAATAEGQVCWDSDSDLLYVGDGAAAVSIGNPFGASIDSTDITNNTITAADIADDELDYVDFKDAMAVDADTSTNLAGNDLTFSDATGGGAFSVTTNGAALSLTSNGTATWSVTGAGNDLTIDSADVLNLGTANATAITMGKAGVTTTNIGILQTGNAANTGSLKVADGSANYVTITSPAIGADYTLTLPVDDGTNGQILTTNGSGVLSWTSASGSGDITAVGSMTSGDTFADSTADDDWLGLGVAAGRIEFDDQATDEVNILAANVGIGTQTPGAKLEITPSLVDALRINPYSTGAGNTGAIEFMELAANGSNYVGFKAPDSIATNIAWTLPNADGTSGQMLTTNGTGTLSWTSSVPSTSFMAVKYKSANEDVVSSTVLQNDDNLSFSIGANETWTATYSLLTLTQNNTPDLLLAVTAPSGATCNFSFSMLNSPSSGAETNLGCGVSSTRISLSAGVNENVFATLRVTNGGTAGTVNLQWSQATSNANYTRIQAGSTMQAYKAN